MAQEQNICISSLFQELWQDTRALTKFRRPSRMKPPGRQDIFSAVNGIAAWVVRTGHISRKSRDDLVESRHAVSKTKRDDISLFEKLWERS